MKHYISIIILLLFCGLSYGQTSNDFNPDNPPEPQAQYTLTLQAFPVSGGTVSGGGKYGNGAKVSVNAYTQTGFRFDGWYDSNGEVVSNSASFRYVMGNKQTTLTARFIYDPSNPDEPTQQKLKHILTLVSEPASGGNIGGATNGGRYCEGDAIYMYASPNTGFKFSEWKMGEQTLSTNSSYTHTMGTENQEIKAVFYYDPSNPNEPDKPTGQEYALITLTTQAPPNMRVVYPVYLLSRSIDITTVSFDIQFPENVPVDYESSTLATNRSNGHTMTITPSEGVTNGYHVDVSGSNPLQGEEGVLVYIPITIPEAWENHESHPVTLTNALIDGSLALPVRNGAVTSFIDDGQLNIRANFYTDAFFNRIQFKNLSSDEQADFLWDFGDGTTSTEKDPFHVFASSGDYTVKLTASNEYGEDVMQLKVSVPAKESWKLSGTLLLDKDVEGAKCFKDAPELFTFMNTGSIVGDMIVQVKGGQSFDIPMTAEISSTLQSLTQKLVTGNYLLNLNSDGGMSIINFSGTPNPEYFKSIMDLGKQLKHNNINISIFNIPVDITAIYKIKEQVICSGENMAEVNLKTISQGLTFQWRAMDMGGAISGYMAEGTDVIPQAVLQNSTTEADSLIYQIDVQAAGVTLYTCTYKVVVLPGLIGTLDGLFPDNGEEQESTTVRFSWKNITNSVYDLYLWESGTVMPSTPLAANLISNSYISRDYCKYGKSYQWKVAARNKCSTMESEVGSFSIRALPDLHVTEITYQDPIAGKGMEVKWKVRNDGKGSTKSGKWNDYIWLVPDVYTGTTNECTLLATVQNMSALEPGQYYENIINVELPERVSGNYYLLVTSDMYNIDQIDWTPTGKNEVANPYTPSVDGNPYPYLKGITNAYNNQIEENGETENLSDNFFYATIDIQLPPLPDLFVNSIIPPDNFYSGQEIKVNATIVNQGTGNIVDKSWYDELYLSHENILDKNSAIFLGSCPHKGTMNQNDRYDVEFKVVVPLDFYGTAYFFVVTNANDDVFEHANANNNTVASNAISVVLTPPADLVPMKLQIPSVISTGADYDLSVQIKNEGAGYTDKEGWTDRVYLSKKSTGIDESATELLNVYHGGKLAPGDSYMINKTITPRNLDEGEYFIYVAVDAENTVFELAGTKENNILMTQAVTVVKPELKVEIVSVETSLLSGRSYPVSWKIMNTGEGEVKDKKIVDHITLSRIQNGTNATYIDDVEHILSIKGGEEKIVSGDIALPYNENLNGTCYMFVKTDYNNNVYEKNENNNLSPAYEVIYKYVPKPDISITDLSVQTQVKPGENLTLEYALNNVGAVDFSDEDYQISVYLSKKAYADKNAVKCESQSILGDFRNIGKGGSVRITHIVNIPEQISGGDMNVYVAIDEEKVLDEANVSNNTAYGNTFIAGNLPDLAIMEAKLPEIVSSEIETEIEWTVTNQGNIACGTRTDAVYLSADMTLDSGDERLSFVNAATLNAGESQVMKAKVTFPDKLNGKRYLIIKLDYYNLITVIDASQNVQVSPIEVSLSPLPDLQIKKVIVPDECISGQTLKIYYEVINNGVNATRQSRWSDEVYLSETTTLNKRYDLRLGGKIHSGILESGESYEDSIEVNVPSYLSGNYTLFVYTDAGNVVYESGSENNNVKNYALTVRRPLPADLVVEEVVSPVHIIAGEQTSISYKIKNNSTYPATGVLKDAIYVSEDPVWDVDDLMVGTTSGYASVDPGSLVKRTVTGIFSNVPVGDYYLIVRTNITNNIIESTISNNYTAASNRTAVDFKELMPESSESVFSSGYFKVKADGIVGETLALNLLSDDENIHTGLYVAHNKVPTVSEYDFASSQMQAKQQEVLIPSLEKGLYYVLARDNSKTDSGNLFSLNGDLREEPLENPLTVFAHLLHFEIAGVTTGEGGNGGSVTSDITGAKFDTIMDFRLKDAEQYIPAEAVYFQNQTSSYVTFNLRDANAGSYDVVAELPGGMKTVMNGGYKVISGVSVPLYTKIVAPSSVRLNTKIPFAVEYGNTGNTDIEVLELLLVSENGHPIGLNTQELDSARTEIRIPLYDSNTGNKPAVLSPNAKGTRTVFVYANNASSISLKLYIIRKDY